MLEILTTSDGSHTIKNAELNETYHSIHGAIQESSHVFIRHGLDYFIKNFQPPSVKILEVGFGTGLNALLTILNRKASTVEIEYTGIEAYPLSNEIISQLNYPDCFGEKEAEIFFNLLHNCPWEKAISITSKFRIVKISENIQKFILEKDQFDIVYFDAFAPGKQPEMWELNVLSRIVNSIKQQGIFVTYSAKGQLKRDLRSLGMEVEILEGPPGKMQMTRAKKTRLKMNKVFLG